MQPLSLTRSIREGFISFRADRPYLIQRNFLPATCPRWRASLLGQFYKRLLAILHQRCLAWGDKKHYPAMVVVSHGQAQDVLR